MEERLPFTVQLGGIKEDMPRIRWLKRHFDMGKVTLFREMIDREIEREERAAQVSGRPRA